MEFSELKFIRLQPETEILPFDCGDHDLNGFLFDDAKNYAKDLMAVTYLLHNDKETVAYFNYFNDKISHTDIDGNIEMFLERVGVFLPEGKSDKKSYPAVKIGRLGVHTKHQSSGLGKAILDYTKDSFVTNNKTGCKFIVVDAYKNSVKFYEKNGFMYLSGRDKKSDTRLMYFNLEAI
ncbi:GNAT family N-acetyltransferase [Flagellimonas sp.]|uniref:GNAT family N-acetyltransferase n=1 Tax=Flagellimonas sp. TaxID=2058762 RepID=UPI003BAAB98A